MATTTNYSWTTPDDTDLVKDGAAAIRTLGSSADTTVKDLNPGTTAGDIDYYTSGTAKARVAIGTAGQVLQVNSGATAPEWAAPAAGGKVLQVVQVVYGTEATSSSASFVDTGLSATITPTLATSTILVMANHLTNGTYGGGGSIGNLKLFRDATQILDGSGDFQRFGRTVDAVCFNYIYLDNPATTSATTYKTTFANEAGAGLVAVQRYNTKSTMILMEIGA
jgi:hypothetical protein